MKTLASLAILVSLLTVTLMPGESATLGGAVYTYNGYYPEGACAVRVVYRGTASDYTVLPGIDITVRGVKLTCIDGYPGGRLMLTATLRTTRAQPARARLSRRLGRE